MSRAAACRGLLINAGPRLYAPRAAFSDNVVVVHGGNHRTFARLSRIHDHHHHDQRPQLSSSSLSHFSFQPPPKNTSRSYQSIHQPPSPPSQAAFSPAQAEILLAALAHLPAHGFTLDALRRGARDAGYLDVSLQLFPRGGELELVHFYLVRQREELARKAEGGELWADDDASKTYDVDAKVGTLIWTRLMMNAEIRQHWQQALAILASPSNLPTALSELYALASSIFYLADDSAVDTAWYTRRLSVATAYASTDAAMTEDTTPGFAYTQEFLNRRLHDVDAVGNGLCGLKQYLGFTAHTVYGIGRSWGLKI